MADRRIAALDVLRGIAIAAVVARHVTWRMLTPASLAAPGGHFLACMHFASALGVPLFVAVSAFALAWRHGGPLGGVRGYLGFLAMRARRLLPAYVLWSLASLAAKDVSLLSRPGDVAWTLLSGTADVQFYFVPMIFELYVLWPLLRVLVVRRTPAGALAVLAAGAAGADLSWRGVWYPTWTALSFFATSVAAGAGLSLLTLQGPASAQRPFCTSPRLAGRVLAVALAAGAAWALHASVEQFLVLTAGTSQREVLYLLANIFARGPMAYATLLTGALAIVAVPVARTAAGRVLAALGRESYGIFLIHLLVASTFVYRFFELGAHGSAAAAAVRLLAVWSITLGASHALAVLLARIPHAAWMVGRAGSPGTLDGARR